jgi:hypothetical protein
MSLNSRVKKNSIASKPIIIFVSLVLVLGLFATSYHAGFTFIVGFLLFYLGWWLLKLGRRIFILSNRSPLVLLGTSLLMLGIIFITLIGLSRFLFLGRAANQIQIVNERTHVQRANQPGVQSMATYDLINSDIIKYQAFIKPKNESLNEFEIQEECVFKYTSEFEDNKIAKTEIINRLKEVINQNIYIKEAVHKKMGFLLKRNDSVIDILNKNIEVNLDRTLIIHGQKAGFALQKVSFLPLRNINFSSVNNSSSLAIEITNLPKGSFYELEGNKTETIDRNEFVGDETIKWSIAGINREIQFAYFPFPYYYFSPILKLFTGIASFSDGILTMLGVISAYVVANLNKLGLLKILQGWLEKKLEEFRNRKKVLTEPKAEVLMGNNSLIKQPQANLENSNDELDQENPFRDYI